MTSHREKGDAFAKLAREAVEQLTGLAFQTEVALPVGSPPRNHNFDFATSDRRLVGEAKAYMTKAGLPMRL